MWTKRLGIDSRRYNDIGGAVLMLSVQEVLGDAGVVIVEALQYKGPEVTT